MEGRGTSNGVEEEMVVSIEEEDMVVEDMVNNLKKISRMSLRRL